MSFSNPYAWWRLKHALVKPSHELEYARLLPDGDGYDCPNCEGELKLAKGSVVPPYFAHVANEDLELCTEESVLLKTAKLLLAQVINDWVKGVGVPPSIRRECDRCRRHVTVSPPVRTTRAEAEFAPPPLRHDVSVLGEGGATLLAIQVRVGSECPGVYGPWIELSARAVIEDPLEWHPLNWGGLEPIESCIGCQLEEAGAFQNVDQTNPYVGPDLAGKVFGPGGLMSKVMDGYEERVGQRELAVAIDAAIRAHTNLMAEGPCGTGKSAAYLAIALSHAIHTGGTVLVSTANKSLQDQLYDKDVPMVLKALGKDVRYEIMRGRSNYVCQGRLEGWERAQKKKADKEGMFSPKQHEEHPVSFWANGSEDGDITRAPFEIETQVRKRVCGARSECSMVCGGTAKAGNPCFYQQARKRAKKATLVITNHAMLFAHMSIKKKLGEAVLLPDAEIICVDEGHELVEYARNFFETSYSEGRCKRLGLKPEERRKIEDLEVELFRAAQSATHGSNGNIDSAWINGHAKSVGKEIIEEIETIVVLLDGRLERLITEVEYEYGDKGLAKLPAEVRKRLGEAKTRYEESKNMRRALVDVLELREDKEAQSPKAYWLEYSDRGTPSLKGCPVNVSKFIHESLFADRAVSTIVTSATLTTAGSFDHLGKEIGFGTRSDGYAGNTCVVESPFDFERQSILVVPSHFDMPTEPAGKGRKAFMERSAELFMWVAQQTGGGVLFLFASRVGMNAVTKRIPKDFPFKILVQGDMSTKRLKEEFMNDENSCLLGLKTFWAGLDIPGHALRCVIVDKMPFIPPSDPFQHYRQKNFSRGVAMNYMVESALLQLRQGVGRLIRTSNDHGAVVILDRRILSRPSYSGKVMKSLPWSGRPQEGLGALQRYFA